MQAMQQLWRVTITATVDVEAATEEQARRAAVEMMRYEGEFTVVREEVEPAT
jgi:hypothetical protein